jgi:hypothetical protein
LPIVIRSKFIVDATLDFAMPRLKAAIAANAGL